MFQKKNLSRWLRTQLSSTNAKKRTRGSQTRTGRKMLLESLERREVFDAGWATTLQAGLNVSDTGHDSEGNHYITGSFRNAATFGNFTLPSNGSSSDVFVAKQDANGEYLWAVRAGNPLTDENSRPSIAVDSSGRILISGDFDGTAQFGGISLTSAGDRDVFVAKIDGITGQFLWASQYGNNDRDVGYGLAVDLLGNVIVSGGSGVVPNDGKTPTLFVTKLDTNGSTAWTKTVSGAMTGTLDSVVIDAAGAIYAGGRFRGTLDFETGPLVSAAYLVASGGWTSTDGLIFKLDPNGNSLWARSVAGDTFNRVTDMVVGPDQQLYVSGAFEGKVDFAGNTSELQSAGSTDAYVAKLDATTGGITWAQRLGGPGPEVQTAGPYLAFDPQGNLNIAGTYRETANFGMQTLTNDNSFQNAFVAKLSNTGTFLAAHRVVTGVSTGNDKTQVIVTGFDIDLAGNTYIAGVFVVLSNVSSPIRMILAPQKTIQSNSPSTFVIKLPPAAPTKFYVIDESTRDRTYQYGSNGELTIDHFSMNTGNTAPRGAASNAAGTTVWVADKNRKVYVYNNSGTSQGSWTASSLSSTAQVEGVATNGTDVWIVDNATDKVFRHTGAASRVSGSQSAASSFKLNSANSNPKGIVTDGISIWVVNDSTTDKIFKYTVGGSYLGNWTIDSANKAPTGLTIDPTNGSQDIWVVDNGTDKIYQYANSRGRTSDSLVATATYALAVGNTNPQGIADPPAPSTTLATSHAISADNDLAMATAVVGVSVGPVPMPSIGAPSFNAISERSHRRESTVRSTDDIMSNLGRTSQMPQATGSIIRKAPVASQPVDPSESDAFDIEDDEFSDLIGLVANNLWS